MAVCFTAQRQVSFFIHKNWRTVNDWRETMGVTVWYSPQFLGIGGGFWRRQQSQGGSELSECSATVCASCRDFTLRKGWYVLQLLLNSTTYTDRTGEPPWKIDHDLAPLRAAILFWFGQPGFFIRIFRRSVRRHCFSLIVLFKKCTVDVGNQ